MTFASPLRYPGGKSVMAGLLSQVRSLNRLGSHAIAEPFAGGAGASLNLLFREETREIYINDADSAIYSFWWAVINQTRSFLDMLSRTRVCMAEWRRQLVIYRDGGVASCLRRGFATFYLNRCNRSGIIMDGGPIGGVRQEGEWKLNARFNKQELRHRCEKIAEYGNRIHVSGHDGIEFIRTASAESTFFFIDPPYFVKGKTLYLNALDEEYHIALASQLKSMKDASWLLTYDDCPEIRCMYRNWATIRPFSLRYTAAERRSGRELLIAPKWIRLPRSQASSALTW